MKYLIIITSGSYDQFNSNFTIFNKYTIDLAASTVLQSIINNRFNWTFLSLSILLPELRREKLSIKTK